MGPPCAGKDDEEAMKGFVTSPEARETDFSERHELDPSPARREVPVAVVEQRVSNLAQGAMCLVLLTGPFLHILHLIPRGTL